MAQWKENLKTSTGGKNPQPLTHVSKAASEKKHNTRKLAEACERFGIAYPTARAAVSVCREFESDRRLSDLSFGHHHSVAGRDDAAELLEWAAKSEATLTTDTASHRWQ